MKKTLFVILILLVSTLDIGCRTKQTGKNVTISKADSIYNNFHNDLRDISSLKNKIKVESDGVKALKHLKYAYTDFMRCRSQVTSRLSGETKRKYENNTRRYSNGIQDIFNDELF